MTDDAALVRRCLDGEEQGARELVDQFQGVVFAVCYRLMGKREDAEDVAQDVFLRTFRSLKGWDPTRPLKPWILTIATNRCRTALQQRSRLNHRTVSLGEAAVDQSRDTRELGEELQSAIETLRDDYRLSFVLFYQEHLSCAEIAAVLDCPEGTIKTWLHRARRELADYLRRRGVVPHAEYQLHGI